MDDFLVPIGLAVLMLTIFALDFYGSRIATSANLTNDEDDDDECDVQRDGGT